MNSEIQILKNVARLPSERKIEIIYISTSSIFKYLSFIPTNNRYDHTLLYASLIVVYIIITFFLIVVK